jgi:serine/threonine-protein kinase RsbW
MMFPQGQSYSASFPAVAESVPEARRALARFAAGAGAEDERLDGIRLAVSEAVTNVVRHAYRPQAAGHEPGMVQVNASTIDGELWILIADEGRGLRRRTGTGSYGLGLGLALIAQLADDLQILSRGGGGTEVRMRFELCARDRPATAQTRGSLAIAMSPA